MESTNRGSARVITSRQSQLHPPASIHWLQRPDSHHLTKKHRFLEYRGTAPKDLDDRGKRRVVAEDAYIAGLHHTRAARDRQELKMEDLVGSMRGELRGNFCRTMWSNFDEIHVGG
jgi:hypothetical protein